MAATRQYRRQSNGQFAGANGGSKVTTGRSGGFANATFRSRIQASRAQKASVTGGGRVSAGKGRTAGQQYRSSIKKAALKGAKRAAIAGTIRFGVGIAATAYLAKQQGLSFSDLKNASRNVGRLHAPGNSILPGKSLKNVKVKGGAYKISKF